jgi:hypothetical protein
MGLRFAWPTLPRNAMPFGLFGKLRQNLLTNILVVINYFVGQSSKEVGYEPR